MTFALVGSGCQNKGPGDAVYFTDTESKQVNAALDQQIANGAKNDAMLRPQHFDGDKLNSLGKEKLGRMVKGNVRVVYITDAEQFDVRKQAVLEVARNVEVKQGINPGTLHSASEELARMGKTELGGSGEQGDAGGYEQGGGDDGLGAAVKGMAGGATGASAAAK